MPEPSFNVALLVMWSQLVTCMLVIGVAGYWLSHYGSAIGTLTGMGGSWIGFTLLASVTTLPELVTGYSALRLADVPDIAVGGLLGSAVFNMTILVALEVLSRGGLYAKASRAHLAPAALAAGMLGVVISSLLLEHTLRAPSLAHVGLYTALLLAGWVWALRVMFNQDQVVSAAAANADVADVAAAAVLGPPDDADARKAATPRRARRKPPATLRHALAGYAASAVAVVVAGVWLPFVAKGLAQAHGWEQSFVGTLLVAMITSAPELAVTLSAARLGQLDMAIGNVMGANLLNVAMIGLGDILYTGGPLLHVVSIMHVATAIAAVVMTLLFIIGLQGRARRHVFGGVSVIGVLLLLTFLASAIFQYHGAGP